MREMVEQLMREYLPRIRQELQPTTEAPAAQTDERPEYQTWGGGIHRVPEDFALPKATMVVAFQQWMCGSMDQKKSYPPIRQLTAADMSTTNKKKRLSQFRSLMKKVEQHARSRGDWPETPTQEVAAEMFKLGVQVLDMGDEAPRIDQFTWRTIANRVEKRARKRHRTT